MNGTVVDLEVDTRLDERPHVGAVEGVEIAGADLDGPRRPRLLHLYIVLSFPSVKDALKISLDEMKNTYDQYFFNRISME